MGEFDCFVLFLLCLIGCDKSKFTSNKVIRSTFVSDKETHFNWWESMKRVVKPVSRNDLSCVLLIFKVLTNVRDLMARSV
jgi:hypothetical protein